MASSESSGLSRFDSSSRRMAVRTPKSHSKIGSRKATRSGTPIMPPSRAKSASARQTCQGLKPLVTASRPAAGAAPDGGVDGQREHQERKQMTHALELALIVARKAPEKERQERDQQDHPEQRSGIEPARTRLLDRPDLADCIARQGLALANERC